jgi:hypothetical protein
LLHSAALFERAAAVDTLTYTLWQKKKHQAAVFDLITKEEGTQVGEFSNLLVFYGWLKLFGVGANFGGETPRGYESKFLSPGDFCILPIYLIYYEPERSAAVLYIGIIEEINLFPDHPA